MSVRYDRVFFDYVSSGSTRSARVVLPLLQAALPIRSVLDVGCGAGAWLAVWRELGVNDILGLDGDYVDRGRLLIPRAAFLATDLTQPFDCGRQFDLVQCLEVAEHLPAGSADLLVASLVKHGRFVLFSAAPPGQGGDHHVNEQDYEFWRRRFAVHGYLPVDYVRPRVRGHGVVEPWYRYNAFLFVHAGQLPGVPVAIRDAAIAEHVPLPDVSPRLYRCRKALLRRLPVPLSTALSRVKQRVVAQWRRYDSGVLRL